MSKPTSPFYKIKNWPAYNEALKRRGSLTIWFDPAMTWDAAPTGKRGRQPDCSDAAIQTCLTIKVLFGMALRQTTGFVESLLRLTDLGPGRAELQHAEPPPEDPEGEHPLSRVPRPAPPPDRQYRDQGRGRRGVERPQAWRHEAARLAQDPHRNRRANTGNPGCRAHHQRRRRCRAGKRHRFKRTGEGCCPSFSTRSHTIRKSPASLPTAPSTPATCHEAIAARGAAAIIPPRKNAKPWKPDTPGAIARNEALRASKRFGRMIWRRWSGCHRRSRVETKMHCVKLLGQRWPRGTLIVRSRSSRSGSPS